MYEYSPVPFQLVRAIERTRRIVADRLRNQLDAVLTSTAVDLAADYPIRIEGEAAEKLSGKRWCLLQLAPQAGKGQWELVGDNKFVRHEDVRRAFEESEESCCSR